METNTSFVLTAKQRAALNACYRFLLLLSARRKEEVGRESLDSDARPAAGEDTTPTKTLAGTEVTR